MEWEEPNIYTLEVRLAELEARCRAAEESVKRKQWDLDTVTAQMFEAQEKVSERDRRIAELEAALSAAREDSARLDWLESEEYSPRSTRTQVEDGFEIWWYVLDYQGFSLGHPHGTVRAAIDAARKK